MSLRRYHFIAMRAECLGGQSTCARLQDTYGSPRVLAAGAAEERATGAEARADNAWIRVRCEKCGDEWRRDNG